MSPAISLRQPLCRVWVGIALFLGAAGAGAEQPPSRSVAVLQTTDRSAAGLGAGLQPRLVELLKQLGFFNVQSHPISLVAYTPEPILETFKRTQAEILIFGYSDAERVALFLFDENRPLKYVATSEVLAGSPTNRMTPEWVNSRIDRAFSTLIRQYVAAEFDLIPVVEPPRPQSAPVELSQSEKTYRLFQEMSKVQDGSFYVGAHIGMARFSAMGASASTVNFGGYGGVQLLKGLQLELGANIFSYLLLHSDLRVKLPVLERYLTVSIGANASHVTALVTQNRGFNPTFVQTGQFLFGPTLSFDVPLLGASIRGDVKVLLGDATILLGTYGLAYSL